MRLLRIEGDVSLEEGGKTRSVKENLRLKNDDALSTATKSLVSIGLDDTKLVTLDELSRAVFNKYGRKLKLNLTDGSLFFEVTKPLEEDESFDIQTSTMVVGIRGTSGWVTVEGEHESMIITEGKVHVVGTNPVTGETKEIDVKAGNKVSTYLYNDREIDSIMFELEVITEHDLPEFVLERLREDEELIDRVCEATDWDKPWILGVKDPFEEEEPEAEPTPEAEEERDTQGLNETTPTPTPTAEPTRTEKKKTEQELLEELLAMLTPTPTPIPNYIGPGNYTTDSNGVITTADGTTIEYRNYANPPVRNHTSGATVDLSGTGLVITDNSVTPAETRNVTSMNQITFENQAAFPTTLTKTINGKEYKLVVDYDPNDATQTLTTLYEDGVVMAAPTGGMPNPANQPLLAGGVIQGDVPMDLIREYIADGLAL